MLFTRSNSETSKLLSVGGLAPGARRITGRGVRRTLPSRPPLSIRPPTRTYAMKYFGRASPTCLRSMSHVCKCNERHHPIPNPIPPPQQLRSMSHVCKCNERHHPIPNPIPPPQQLRSMSHVCKCNERPHVVKYVYHAVYHEVETKIMNPLAPLSATWAKWASKG